MKKQRRRYKNKAYKFLYSRNPVFKPYEIWFNIDPHFRLKEIDYARPKAMPVL